MKLANQRRRARIMALQALYEVDQAGHDIDTVLDRIIEHNKLIGESNDYAKKLAKGVLQNKKNIHALIAKYAPALPLYQIAFIDRNILCLAIFEILFDNDTPIKVSVNEAIELSKKFGSNTSQRFVNGVLGAVIENEINHMKAVGL